MGRVLFPYALVALVLQWLLLAIGVRTVQQVYRARELEGHSLLHVAASGPLISLSVLNLANWFVTRRIRRWVKHVNATRFD